MKIYSILTIVICLVAFVHCDVAYPYPYQYAQEGYPAEVQYPQQTILVQDQKPEQPKNIFGLPSMGAGLADIGETIANWGAGVLETAGKILKK